MRCIKIWMFPLVLDLLNVHSRLAWGAEYGLE
mgnify:CR=1 FL=1